MEEALVMTGYFSIFFFAVHQDCWERFVTT